jgi:hypothetical protein
MPRINPDHYKSIDSHLAMKQHNRHWIQSCLSDKPEAFPYSVASKGSASLDGAAYIPRLLLNGMPTAPQGQEPGYVINIPLAYGGLKRDPQLLDRLLTIIKDQAFGATPQESAEPVRQRVAVVLGVNRFESIDPAINREFTETMYNLEPVQEIAYRVFGFFWKPELTPNPQGFGLRYPARKGYMILKALNPEKASAVLSSVEGENLRSQIPFQLIREAILTNPASRAFAAHFQRPKYLGVMDGDTKGLRTQIGLFSRVDQAAQLHNLPSAITFGYQLAPDELPILRLGVKLDMKVREAMNSIIPYSPYFPEPGSFFRIVDQLNRLSFLGDGRTLESRRMIENGRANQAFDPRAIFGGEGGVVTGTPDRMKTETVKAPVLTRNLLKQKKTLRALRGIAQTHLHPKEWADNLYLALGFKNGRVTNITKHLMHIFAVFDPISRMFGGVGNYTAAKFNRALANYDDPLSDGNQNLLRATRVALAALGMPVEKINLVEQAARATGQVIRAVLTEEINR